MVNVKTGQTTEIALFSDYEYHAPEDDSSPLSDLVWSSDGKSIFFLFFKDWLIKHDLETGEDKILYKHTFFERGVLKLSPDGKSLLLGLRYPGEEKSRLLTIPAEGGEEKLFNLLNNFFRNVGLGRANATATYVGLRSPMRRKRPSKKSSAEPGIS